MSGKVTPVRGTKPMFAAMCKNACRDIQNVIPEASSDESLSGAFCAIFMPLRAKYKNPVAMMLAPRRPNSSAIMAKIVSLKAVSPR
jgi:hypothetical protein